MSQRLSFNLFSEPTIFPDDHVGGVVGRRTSIDSGTSGKDADPSHITFDDFDNPYSIINLYPYIFLALLDVVFTSIILKYSRHKLITVFGLIYLLYKMIKQQNKIQYKSIFWGIGLGVPNYFTLYFFIKSLKSKVFESSEVFPIVNMGIIILSALGGIILFREKLSFSNWTGIALAILSIGLISF